MKKILYTLVIIFSLALIKNQAQAYSASDCAGFGYMQVDPSTATVLLNQPAKFTLSFSWGKNPPPASCYQESIGVVYLIDGTPSAFQTMFGAVPAGQTKQGTLSIPYSEFNFGGTSTKTVQIKAIANSFFTGQVSIAETSATAKIQTANSTYACVAADGKYACSTDGTLATCQSSSVCGSSAKSPCTVLADKNDCGRFAPGTSTGGGNQQPTTTTYTLDIQSPAQFTDLVDLVNKISVWIFNISIPIAVIIIIYAGVRFLLSRGVPGEVTKAKEMLTYAVVGLAIVLIGRGFVSLVTSIIDLGGSGTPTSQSQQPTSPGAGENSSCQSTEDCQAPLRCLPAAHGYACQAPAGTTLCSPACSTSQSCVRVINPDGSTVRWQCQ